ncbi:MAG: hypothetical protein U9R16_09035, partial [Campylobacterota bacterium]|nr:hypothetical protein [Campylobacterota bacterium]
NVPKAYCWDIEYINSSNSGIEYLIDKRNTIKKHLFSKDIFVMINVYGYPQNKPKVLINKKVAKFIKKKDISNRLGNINYTKYLFKLPIIDTKKAILEVKDFNQLKRMLYIK